ncbi:MAG: phage tail protein [Ramlibacter sp.]|nr:phage tail protein [Ramlibacter sp.]
MPSSSTTASELKLTIGGLTQAFWQSYEVESDLLKPADAWRVSLGLTDDALPAGVQPGAAVTLHVDGELVLSGICDEMVDGAAKDRRDLELCGRDGAGVLLDCSAPVFTATQQTLAQVVAKVVRPLGVTKVRIDAQEQFLRERVSTEPGDSAWSALQRAAEANGLWPWFEPDGTLVVGGPDYASEPVAELVMRRSGRGNNMTILRRKRDISESFSTVTVLGQAHSGTTSGVGKHNVRATVEDTGVPVYRPKILCDHEAQTEAIARARGRKLISDSRLKGFELQAEVVGHRVGPAPAPLWRPGQRVRVISEPHDIDGVFFLMGRSFILDRKKGQITRLRLKEDGVWTLDAHPHKRKHRRGKNSLPGKVVDASVRPGGGT